MLLFPLRANSISIDTTDTLLSGLHDYVSRSLDILSLWYSAWTESNTVDDDQQQTYDENKGSLDTVITESDAILAETPTLPVVEVGDNLNIDVSPLADGFNLVGVIFSHTLNAGFSPLFVYALGIALMAFILFGER